jgi:hypothetical protein
VPLVTGGFAFTPGTTMTTADLHRETFRRDILCGTGLIGPLHAIEELRRARFFIKRMEEFISSSENAEITVLETEAASLSEEAKDEFWQWHYPIHWQDIFGVRIRSAFCVQLCSHVEATLGDIAHRVQVIERSAIKVRDLKGSTIDRHKLYLAAFNKFGGPAPELWKKMSYVFRIRNAHIHQQGHDSDIEKHKEFSEFLASLPNVGTDNSFIELKAGSCLALLEITEKFHDSLLQEYEVYRQRALTVEQPPVASVRNF